MGIGVDNRLNFFDPALATRISSKSIEILNKSALQDQPQVVVEGQDTPIPLEQVLTDPSRFKDCKQAYLSVPLANGKTQVIPLDNLKRESLLAALQSTAPLNPIQQGEIIKSAAPIISQIRHQGTGTLSGEAAPQFTGIAPATAKLNPVDEKNYQILADVEKAVDEKIKKGQLPAAKRTEAILDGFLLKTVPTLAKMPHKREQLVKFLASMGLDQLIGAQIQGAGGAAAGAGVTGSGSKGHYVNSILSSLVQLLSTDRLSKQTFDNLKAMQSAPLHDDIKDQRVDLIRCAMQDIAFPQSINQHAKGTCAATNAQILLALKDPAAYVKVVTQLASPDGKVAEGAIVRETGTLQDDKSGRSLSGRLIQPAFMEYADDALTYDNATDVHSDTHNGLKDFETARLITYLFPAENYSNYSIFNSVPKPTKEQVYAKLKTHVDAGTPISVGLRWDDGGHRVIVSKIDEAKKEVYLLNPWGELQTMPLDEFQDRLRSACLPQAAADQGPALDKLPGVMRQTEAYQPLDTAKFRTPTEQMQKDPILKAAFTADQQSKLGALLTANKLGTFALDYLRNTVQKNNLSEAQKTELVTQLLRAGSDDEIFQLLKLTEAAYDAVKLGQIDAQDVSRLLNVRPGAQLDSADNEALLTAIKGNDKAKFDQLVEKAAQGMAKGYAEWSFVTKPIAEREGAKLLALADVMDSSTLIPDKLKTALLAVHPEKVLNQAEMEKLLWALTQGKTQTVEFILADVLLKSIDSWSVDQAAQVLEDLGKAGNWDAFKVVFGKIAGEWTMKSDNVAEAAATRLSGVIDQAPKEVVHALYKTMDDWHQDADTRKAKAILEGAKNW